MDDILNSWQTNLVSRAVRIRLEQIWMTGNPRNEKQNTVVLVQLVAGAFTFDGSLSQKRVGSRQLRRCHSRK
jgi:hypothetical protein